MYEAIEHWIYGKEDLARGTPIRLLDVSGRDRALAQGCPDLRLICGQQRVPLTRARFASLVNPAHTLLFPAVFLQPGFRSRSAAENRAIADFRLGRYSTNSGTAAGATREESLLHGILEVVERDAIGIELLRTVIKQRPYPVREISLDSLPEPLRMLQRAAAMECNAQIKLWDITSDLKIPAILCALQPKRCQGQLLFGSGASLSPRYALERAILEAVQTFHTHFVWGVDLPTADYQSASPTSRYGRCFMEAGYFGFRGGSVARDFSRLQGSPENVYLSPTQQLETLVALLDRKKIRAYERSLKGGDVHVTQVVLPQLERFHLASYGIPVAPGARGRSVIRRALVRS